MLRVPPTKSRGRTCSGSVRGDIIRSGRLLRSHCSPSRVVATPTTRSFRSRHRPSAVYAPAASSRDPFDASRSGDRQIVLRGPAIAVGVFQPLTDLAYGATSTRNRDALRDRATASPCRVGAVRRVRATTRRPCGDDLASGRSAPTHGRSGALLVVSPFDRALSPLDAATRAGPTPRIHACDVRPGRVVGARSTSNQRCRRSMRRTGPR